MSAPADAAAAAPIVVLTQAAESATSLAADLDDVLPAGTIAFAHWPLLAVAPTALESVAPTLGRLATYRWLFLPSPTAIEMMALQLQRLDIVLPEGIRIGLTGPGSRSTFLQRFGDGAIVTPLQPPYDATHLIDVMARADPQGRGLPALVAGRGARPGWVARLAETMRPVDVVALFHAHACQPPPDAEAALTAWVASGRAFCWVCGSRGQVDSLAAWIAALGSAASAARARAAPMEVPHRDIALHAERAGFERVGVFEDRTHLAGKLQSWPRPHSRPHRGSADLATERPSDPGKPSAATPPTPPAAPADQTPKDPGGSTAPRVEGAKAEPAKTAPPANPKAGAGGAGQAASRPAAAKPSAADPPPAVAASAPPPPPPPPPPPSTAREPRGGGAGWVWPVLLLLLIAGLAVAGWWTMQQQLQRASIDNARRVAEAESRAKQLEAQIKAIQDAQGQLVARSGRLEAKISESSEQQEQLTALYDDIAKSRGDGTLAEVEQSVVAAAQQLQLNGNVKAALIALENAQRRLGDSDRAETSIGLRRLIAQDIERLKALPAIDIAGAAGKLDDVIARVDNLPLMSEVSTPAEAGAASGGTAAGQKGANAPAGGSGSAAPAGGGAPAGAAPAPAADGSPSAFERMYEAARQAGTSGLEAVREEFGKLVSIRRIDKPDTMLMAPDQRRMARDNLRLQLLNARINLLNREQPLFRKDLDTAIAGIEKWFDTGSGQVKQSISTLRSLQGQPLTMQYPDLSESLGAIRSAKAATEKKR
ncbi:MAG: uroporphyrinogen-III C-methyltransferase [Lautropia sp.]